jgi:hypothetical protein
MHKLEECGYHVLTVSACSLSRVYCSGTTNNWYVYVAILCRHGRIDYRIHVGCGDADDPAW